MSQGFQIERPPGQRCTVIAIDDLYLIAQGLAVPSSPEFTLPYNVACEAFDAAIARCKSETRSSHLWAAESKRKLMLKKAPWLRYVKTTP